MVAWTTNKSFLPQVVMKNNWDDVKVRRTIPGSVDAQNILILFFQFCTIAEMSISTKNSKRQIQRV